MRVYLLHLKMQLHHCHREQESQVCDKILSRHETPLIFSLFRIVYSLYECGCQILRKIQATVQRFMQPVNPALYNYNPPYGIFREYRDRNIYQQYSIRTNLCPSLRPITRSVSDIFSFLCDDERTIELEKLRSKDVAMHAHAFSVYD